MNSLRDPFNLRSGPAINILRAQLQTQSSQIAAKATEHLAAAQETVKEVADQVTEMAFNAPKHIPSFTDPDRRREDYTWAAAGMTAATGKVGQFAQNLYGERQLPLYKDKPYYSTTSGRRKGMMRKKRTIILGLVLFGLVYLFFFSGKKEEVKKRFAWSKVKKNGDWDAKREEVKKVFQQSWQAYEQHAWGMWHHTSFRIHTDSDQARTNLSRSARLAGIWRRTDWGGSSLMLWIP